MSRPTIDFDPRSAHYRDHWPEIARDLHATGTPMAWSEHYDGFWVLAGVQAVQEVAGDPTRFTSENDLDGTGNGGRGVVIPQAPYRLYLTESDPPLHTDRRRLEMPFFAPKSLRQWGPVIEEYLNEAIDGVIERGTADLVNDIVVPTTARTTLHVVGYDADDWRDAARSAQASSYLLPTDPDYPHAEQTRLRAHFRELLQERRAQPTGDLISALAQGTVQGQPLTDDEGESMMNALIFGGFDTTTSLVAHAIRWASRHPDVQQRLLEDDAFRRNAIEEFLRYFPPTPMIGRTAIQDTELLGQPIAKGERIAMWVAGANRDPSVFEDPDELRFDRPNSAAHLSFSAGHHRCLGSQLAKMEIDGMLSTIFSRMPDVRVEEDDVVPYPSIGQVNGFSRLPITFTPGPRSSAAAPV